MFLKTINHKRNTRVYFLYPGFPGGSDSRDSACNAGDLGSIPGSWRCPGGGHGNPLQSSCLENPMDRGVWWVAVHRVAKSQSWLKWLSTHMGLLGKSRTLTILRLSSNEPETNLWFCSAMFFSFQCACIACLLHLFWSISSFWCYFKVYRLGVYVYVCIHTHILWACHMAQW